MAADDGPVVLAGENRLNEAKLAQASGEGVKFGLADPPGIGRIGAKKIDRDFFDRGGGERRSASGASRLDRTGII